MSARTVFFFVAFVPLLSGCSDRWDGFVYPNKNNLSEHVNIGEFNTLQACRDAALSALASMRGSGDYECGLDCDDGRKMGGIKVCKKTLR